MKNKKIMLLEIENLKGQIEQLENMIKISIKNENIKKLKNRYNNYIELLDV